MGNINLHNLIIIYMILFIYSIERCVFAFNAPDKINSLKKEWLTVIPFCGFIFSVYLGTFEFGFLKKYYLTLGVVGLLVMLLGVVIRYWSYFSMKRNGQPWSMHTGAEHLKSIVSFGPYKYVRHPYYLSVMLELIGVCVFLNSFLTLVCVFIFQLFFLFIRIKDEENELERKFGKVYLEYKNLVKFKLLWGVQ